MNQKKNHIEVIIKHPGIPGMRRKIENSLESLQLLVGGYIETVTFASDAIVVCNEEGRLMDLPYNTTIFGVEFYGTIIIAGVDECEFADVAPNLEDYIPQLKKGW